MVVVVVLVEEVIVCSLCVSNMITLLNIDEIKKIKKKKIFFGAI